MMPADSRPILGVERSLSGKFWRSRLGEERRVLALSQSLDLPEILCRVLAARGVGQHDVATYLSPSLRESMPDPSSLRDMDAAAARLADAIANDELVAVFGDYDVDGATASALLRLYLEAVDGRVRAYIPDRLTEGYGPNSTAFARLKAAGARVIVTLDCGTTAHRPLAAAASDRLDVIVVDHHQAGPDLPPALALINPNRLDDTSGQGALAAVGVAFMLVVALNRELRQRGWFTARDEPDLLQWLDLVALGTVCDLVSLTGLNRPLVDRGLKVIARRANPGLAALIDVCRIKETPSAYHAGYVLGPRINAGGRVGESNLGHRLLVSRSFAEALPIAQRLDRLNEQRRVIEAAMLDQALRDVERTVGDLPPLLVVAGEGWHPGVIGLIASRLVERYGRPAAAIAFNGDEGRGSARSVSGFDFGSAITAARQLGTVKEGGGHSMAAGFTITREKVGAFAELLQERLTRSCVDARPTIGLDGALSPAGTTMELYELLSRAGPYGSGNPEPRFAFPDCRIERAALVGAGHVSCRLVGEGGRRLKAIAFRSADLAHGRALMSASGRPLHIAGHLRADRWNGRNDVQVIVDDVAVAE